MRRLAVRRAVTVLSACFAVIMLTATAAWAPKNLTLPVVDGPCSYRGETGYLMGTFDATRFFQTDGGVSVQGNLNATCDLRKDVVLHSATRTDVSVVSSDCRTLVLGLGSGETRNVFYDLEGDLLVYSSEADSDLFCAIAAARNDAGALVPLLNELLRTTG